MFVIFLEKKNLFVLYPFVTLSDPHPHPNLFYINNASETQVFC